MHVINTRSPTAALVPSAFIFAAVAALASCGAPGASVQGNQGQAGRPMAGPPTVDSPVENPVDPVLDDPVVDDPITDPGAFADTMAADLRFLREEEKLARDVYLTLAERWGLRPHQNIANSEQTHMSRVGGLLDTYGIDDPVVDDTVGVFVNGELAALYTELIARGSVSAEAALAVGATIEDLDIADIEHMLGRMPDGQFDDVRGMYEALQCGSRNHLRAFTRNLRQRGASYEPVYVDVDTYDAILAGSQESCG